MKINVKVILNWMLFIFALVISILSILFFLDMINIYKILILLNLDTELVNKILLRIQTKEVLMYFWLFHLLIVPIWFYYTFRSLKTSEKSLIEIVSKQEKADKLLSYMITDNWGKIIWSGDIFQQIFNIYKGYNTVKLNFLDCLQENSNIKFTKENLNMIKDYFKLQKSGSLDLPITVSMYNSVLNLSFVKIGNNYLWKVLLTSEGYNIYNNNFAQELINNAPIAYAVIDNKGRTIYTNKAFMYLFKVNEEIMLEKVKLDDFIIKKNELEKSDYGLNSINTTIAKGTFKDKEDKEFEGYVIQKPFYKSKAAGIKYIKVSIITTKFDLFSNSSFTKDETTRNEEQKERYQEDTLVGSNIEVQNLLINEVINKCPLSAVVIDDNQQILFSNKLIKEQFHLNKENIELKDIFGKYIEVVKKNLLTLKDFTMGIDINVGSKDRSFKCSSFNLKNNCVVIYFEDITSKKKLEAEVKLSQGLQTVGQIASVVAHDFNNLLTAIMSFTHFLEERHDRDDPSLLELEQIKQNANRAKVMIKQLLTFSRRQELNPISFSVNSEISDLMSTIIRLIGQRMNTSFKRGKNAGNILMDKVQFHQIMTNLVVNAKDAMNNEGNLEIITESVEIKKPLRAALGMIPAGKYSLIEIKDKGKGIEAKDIKAIFKSHFSTKGDKGNGLGLSTVLKIVSDNAGFIDVKSVVGKGSSFILYFPLSQKEEIIDNIKQVKQIEDLTGNETILLVEDEVPVRMVCSRLLRSKGYNVIEAEDGQSALDKITNQDFKIDLVISDVMMPGISGPELIARIRDIYPDIKVILMSGYAEDVLEDINIDVSFKEVEFLEKPFTPDVFASKVKQIIIK